jgi:hypothetical protein
VEERRLLTPLVLQGVQLHLESNVAEKRFLGMVCAEEFTNEFLAPDCAERLDFGDVDRSGFVDEYANNTVRVFLCTLWGIVIYM